MLENIQVRCHPAGNCATSVGTLPEFRPMLSETHPCVDVRKSDNALHCHSYIKSTATEWTSTMSAI